MSSETSSWSKIVKSQKLAHVVCERPLRLYKTKLRNFAITQPKDRCESYKAGIIWSTGTRRLALYANPIFLNFFVGKKLILFQPNYNNSLPGYMTIRKKEGFLETIVKEKPIKI